MALYPNGRYLTCSPGRHFGPSVGLEVYARARGDRLNRFVSDTYARTASTPDGYDVHGTVPAIMAGGWTPFTDLSPEGLAQAVLAALLAGPATPANVVQINSAGVAGTGQSGDMWRGE